MYIIFMSQNESWPDKLLNYQQNLEGSIILNFWLLQQRTQPQRSFNLTKLPWLTKYLVRWPNKTKTRATESFWNTFCIGQTKFVVFFENVKLFKKAQLIVLDWLSDTQFFFVWFKTIVIWWFRNQNLKHQGKHNYF